MYTQDDLALVDGMNKKRLREACKAASITGYSKMTVEKMREALRHHIGRALVAVAPLVMETAFKPIKRNKSKDAAPAKPERKARNGVKRPLDPTSKCGQVWAWLDEHPDADAAAVKAQAEKAGWNLNNASIEFSGWRRFHGVARQTKAA